MSLLQKCQQFFANDFKHNNLPGHVEITTEEWKTLVREHLTPIIEKELQMKQIADFVWASEYKSGMRKVVSFFKINNAYATLKWGWNFEFIPKCSGNKILWARTDKSIYTHIYEVSENFYNSDYRNKQKRKAYDKIVMSRYYFNKKSTENGFAEIVKHHQEALEYLLPTIQDYYHSTGSLEAVLDRIDLNLENKYYSFINPELVISKVFILYRLGLKEKAIFDFENISFRSEEIKNQYYKKLLLL